jgi:predicted short-subunit dehydrogenase-like oxidoreductase (DUF2520 family)
MVQFNLSFAGAGRVASTLCLEMYQAGHKIIDVVSKTNRYGASLAALCKASWSDELSFRNLTDIIIVSVPDRSLKEVLSSVRCSEKTLVAHTAGSYGLEVFPATVSNKAVFYPLQTFTTGRKIDFRGLPFMIETSGREADDTLTRLAESIGGKAYFIDNNSRKRLHLAAVFVCNFTNHMLTIGKNLATEAGLSFSVLEPLVRETIAKALETDPEKSQTGPAVRNDLNTIEKHLDLLSFSPELQNIYREVTLSIQKHYNKALNDKF